MRIIHVTDAYLPRLGGIELHVHDLAEQQRRRGHDVTVLTGTSAGTGDGPHPADDADPDHTEPDPVPVVRLGRLAWSRPLPAELLTADVVHCHSSIVSPLAWAAARRAERAGVPAVVTMHSVVQRSAVVQEGLRAAVAVAGAGVTWAAVSGVAAQALQPLVPRPVLLLPNGIDPDDWRPGPARARRPGDPVTLVAVGRLAARKRVVPLVDILAEVRRRLDPDVQLRAVLAGDGPHAGAVRQRLRVRGIESWVQLPGRLTRPQVRRLYAGADVFLAPAVLESFGLAALEARCAGLPVIARAQAGVGEFIRPGVEGLLVPDDDEMARATADLLGDPAALARISDFNRGVRTPLDWPGVLDRCLDAYAAAGAPASVTSRQSPPVLPRPTRPRGWCSWETPNGSASSTTIAAAFGTSTLTFDHGGGDEHVHLAAGEPAHHRVPHVGRHPAAHRRDSQSYRAGAPTSVSSGGMA